MKLQNVTILNEPVRHGRRYRDACGAAFALELLGERWALLIMRELMFGPRRFGAIRAGLPALSARVLAERLGELEAAGIVRHALLPPPASVPVYELTDWGRAADEAMLALCRWSLVSPGHDPSLFLSPAALMMSMRALFRSGPAEGLRLAGALVIGDDEFAATIADGRLEVARGSTAAPAFALAAADTRLFMRLLYGKAPLPAVAGMGLKVGGDPALLARFVDCFALPAKLG